jgi:hypothetical protein
MGIYTFGEPALLSHFADVRATRIPSVVWKIQSRKTKGRYQIGDDILLLKADQRDGNQRSVPREEKYALLTCVGSRKAFMTKEAVTLKP